MNLKVGGLYEVRFHPWTEDVVIQTKAGFLGLIRIAGVSRLWITMELVALPEDWDAPYRGLQMRNILLYNLVKRGLCNVRYSLERENCFRAVSVDDLPLYVGWSVKGLAFEKLLGLGVS